MIRRNTGRTRRPRGPDPTVQTIIWGSFLLGSATLAAILRRPLASS